MMNETQIIIVTYKKSEIFDILELPNPESELIKSERLKTINKINFQQLASDFTQLGDLIRLAENGAVGRPQIQIQIRNIGRIITKLVGDTSLAMHSFEISSNDVVETLKNVYEYLFDSLENQALIELAGIEKTAKEMLDTATKLKNDANKACERVEDVQNAANKQRGEDEEDKKNIDLEREQYSSDKEKLTEKQDDVQEILEDLEGKINITDKKIEKAEKDRKNWLFEIFSPSNSKERAENEKKEKKRLIEEQRRQKDARYKADEEIAALALKIRQCEDKSVLSKAVIKSLIKAISSLNEIEGIMENARMFWGKMYEYCVKLSTEGVRQTIETALEDGEIKRQKLYRSKPFKRRVVTEYAKWIAMRDTCLRYKNKIDYSHRYFVEYLKESPTREQSRKIVEDLSTKFEERRSRIEEIETEDDVAGSDAYV